MSNNVIGGGIWQAIQSDYRVRHFWLLACLALVLHGILDPGLSYLAVVVLDAGVETNPWLATLFTQGPLPLFISHLPLFVLCGGFCYAYTRLFQIASAPVANQLYYIALAAWTGIILWGGILVSRALAAILIVIS